MLAPTLPTSGHRFDTNLSAQVTSATLMSVPAPHGRLLQVPGETSPRFGMKLNDMCGHGGSTVAPSADQSGPLERPELHRWQLGWQLGCKGRAESHNVKLPIVRAVGAGSVALMDASEHSRESNLVRVLALYAFFCHVWLCAMAGCSCVVGVMICNEFYINFTRYGL